MPELILSKADIQKLSPSTQEELINLIFNRKREENSGEDFGELTKKQVFDLIKGLSEKSQGVLKAIASFNSNSINFNDLLQELDTNEQEIKGVWSGLTIRSRNISHDPDFYLLDWKWSEENQAQILIFHPTTYTHIVSYFQ